MKERPHLLTEEAAEYLGVSRHTLAWWRHHGVGPRYGRMGQRIVYRVEDLDSWLDRGFEDGGQTPAAS
jgi:excisionase family DNA binding protein